MENLVSVQRQADSTQFCYCRTTNLAEQPELSLSAMARMSMAAVNDAFASVGGATALANPRFVPTEAHEYELTVKITVARKSVKRATK